MGAANSIDLKILYAGSYYAAHFPIGKELEHELSDWSYITMGFMQAKIDLL